MLSCLLSPYPACQPACLPFLPSHSEAVHEGATKVVAAALPHLSAAERREALSGDSTQQAAVLGKEAMLRLLVQEGAPFGLAEREYALYWGLELCSPEAVRLALSWGGGPAELVQHCERARAVAAAVAAARPGSYLSSASCGLGV